MKKIRYNSILTLGTLCVVALAFSACKKPQDTIAKVYVLDAENVPVSGAQVALYGESSEGKQGNVNVADTATSNAAGEAIFNLNDLFKSGQAGVAVLNISASKGALTGEGIIKIEEETTSEETVFIQ